MFYVYEWFIKSTGEIFYVGKGCGRRYKFRGHNRFFRDVLKNNDCDSRIIRTFEDEKDAFAYEYERVNELKEQGLCKCNINKGGNGGSVGWWDEDRKRYYSEHNVMKSEVQRKRMSENNPMRDPAVAKKVGLARRKQPIINGTEYADVIEASKALSVCETSIYSWCTRGYDTYGNPCHYKGEPQKDYPTMKKTHPGVTGSRAVIIDGKHFDTVKEGAAYLNADPSVIIKCLKAGRPYRKVHICEYDNQQPSWTNFGNSSPEGSTTNR